MIDFSSEKHHSYIHDEYTNNTVLSCPVLFGLVWSGLVLSCHTSKGVDYG